MDVRPVDMLVAFDMRTLIFVSVFAATRALHFFVDLRVIDFAILLVIAVSGLDIARIFSLVSLPHITRVFSLMSLPHITCVFSLIDDQLFELM